MFFYRNGPPVIFSSNNDLSVIELKQIKEGHLNEELVRCNKRRKMWLKLILLTIVVLSFVHCDSRNIVRVKSITSAIKTSWMGLKRYPNRRLITTPLQQQNVSSMAECGRFCLLHALCKSFNLVNITNNVTLCELLNQTFFEDPCQLVRHPNATHIATANECTQNDNICGNDRERCIPNDAMNTHECVLKNEVVSEDICKSTHSDEKFVFREVLSPWPFCEMCDQKDVTGAIYILKMTGKENFNRTWKEYRNGFGGSDFWLGNEKIYRLTLSRNIELHIYLSNSHSSYSFYYKHFLLESENEYYRMNVDGRERFPREWDTGIKNCDTTFSTFDKGSEKLKASTEGTGWWYGGDCATNLFLGVWPGKVFSEVHMKLKINL
ncbi:uncharacterized protein LOC130645182 [Hydractinia symbiolongicarpus]|uniref:uncharacterized protein LOC130645182 n=1 Tax=Hydractinia symbiolongicarpus TaxID=13093 RepID=UPI00254C7487|nr:uncharacterized protein LOC130645182 [Hydractinia symbiolongicarpus]